MDEIWYYRAAGQEHGPVSQEQLKLLAHQGVITPADEVRRGLAGRWLAPSIGLFPASVMVSHPQANVKEIAAVSDVLYGISGWLLIPAFGLIASFFKGIAAVLGCVRLANEARVNPTTRALLGAEAWLSGFFVLITAAAAVCFFRKVSFAPKVMIGWLLSIVVVAIVDAALAAEIGRFPVENVAAAVVSSALWIAYFLRSKRVAATFDYAFREAAFGAPERWWKVQHDLRAIQPDTDGAGAQKRKLETEALALEKLMGDEMSMNLYREHNRRLNAGEHF